MCRQPQLFRAALLLCTSLLSISAFAAEPAATPAAPAAPAATAPAEEAAAAAPTPFVEPLPIEELRTLLDPAGDKTARLATLERFKAAAAAGDVQAMYVVGSLYRLGKKHLAKLVDDDAAEAARYLSNAAGHGSIYAMAGMAELELKRKKTDAAVVWGMIASNYAKKSGDQDAADAATYWLDLQKRTREDLGRPFKAEEFLPQVQIFEDNYGEIVREYIAEQVKRSKADPGIGKPQYDQDDLPETAVDGPKPGTSLFLIGVKGGKVIASLLVDDLPGDVNKDLIRGFKKVKFNKTDSAVWILSRYSVTGVTDAAVPEM